MVHPRKTRLRALPMPSSKPQNQPVRREDKETSSFSIDEFIGEIEKAEDERVNKRLPQERLKNKRALDNAARRAAEAAGTGIKPLTPQPLIRKSEGPMPLSAPDTAAKKPKSKRAGKDPALEQAEADGLIVDKGKGKRSAATGMSLKSPKSKANSVVRPTNLDGFGETAQAGFGHVPSPAARSAQLKETGALTARDISRAAAKDPVVMEQMREALATAARSAQQKDSAEIATTSKAKVPGSGSGRRVKLPGQDLAGAQTVGISATVKALEDIILHGRKEVEGNSAWMPHRPAPREKSEGGIPFK